MNKHINVKNNDNISARPTMLQTDSTLAGCKPYNKATTTPMDDIVEFSFISYNCFFFFEIIIMVEVMKFDIIKHTMICNITFVK